MARGEVDLVVTGADRIAANGDTANKIGTYALAVLAAHHGIPLYVVAPTSTVDLATPTGAEIPIEERDPAEVTSRFPARNPGLRRDAGRADHRDRHRGRRPSRAVPTRSRGHPRMKAIILAAGYATRLYPLTETIAKPLLPVGGRPMLDHILDRIGDVAESTRCTSSRTASSPTRSAGGRGARRAVRRPRRRDDERGRPARRDRRHPLRRSTQPARRRRPARDRGRQPLRLLSRRLRRVVAREGRGERALRSRRRRPRARRSYGVVALAQDERDRVVRGEAGASRARRSPPRRPTSTTGARAAPAPVPRRGQLARPAGPLHRLALPARAGLRLPFEGDWRDIGDADQLLEADNRLRALAGLPPARPYTPG